MPEVQKTLSGFRLDFTKEKVVIAVSHLQTHSDGRMVGSLALTLGKNQHQEPAFSFNFTSDVTRKRLVNNLNEKYPDWQWLPIIDDLIKTVQSLSTAGEDDYIIQPTTSSVKHPGYYIEPVIMKGVPNVVYGDKGVNKTTLALTMLGVIALGATDSSSGLVASETAKVGLLDWENSRDLTDYTLSRLVAGETIPYFELPYLRCRLPLSDDMERVGAFLYKHNIKVVVIDSLGKAAGSDIHDSSGKNTALRFFECLDKFDIPGFTSLIIGQNAKDDTGKRSIFGSTYYTYYSRNIFRLQASRDRVGDDEMIIALIHEEGNFSGKYQPQGFKLTYTKETISISQEVANISQFMERASHTKRLCDFLRDGAKSRQAIIDALGVSGKTADVTLNRAKKRNYVVSLGSGMWGLLHDE